MCPTHTHTQTHFISLFFFFLYLLTHVNFFSYVSKCLCAMKQPRSLVAPSPCTSCSSRSFVLHLLLTHALSTSPPPTRPLSPLPRSTLTWKTVTNKTPLLFQRPFRFLQLVETPVNLSPLPAHKEASSPSHQRACQAVLTYSCWTTALTCSLLLARPSRVAGVTELRTFCVCLFFFICFNFYFFFLQITALKMNTL